MSRCININNSRVQEIAKTLNIPPALAATKIEVWMDKNDSKIPKVEDIVGNRYYDVNKNKDLYEKYNLLASDGNIKIFSNEEEAKRIAKSFDRSPNYDFHARKTTNGWKVLIFNPFTNAEDDMFFTPTQLPLFAKENRIYTLVESATMENNKFKTFLGSNISTAQYALSKILKENKTLSSIAAKLLKADLDVPIEVVDVDYFDKTNPPEGVNFSSLKDDFKGSAFYEPTQRKIYIARGAKADVVPLLIHEILHAYTKHYIANNIDSEVVQEFNRLLQHLRLEYKKGNITTDYPLTNLDELLTGVFTNSSFIKELYNLPATNNKFKNLWDEILNLFKKVFGFNQENLTLLDEVFAYASQIVEQSIDAYNEGQLGSEVFEGGLNFSEEPGNQNSVVKSIQNLQGKQKQEETYYTVEGFETKLKRPSSLAKKTIQDREQFKTDKQIKDQEVYTGTGNLIHSIQAEVIRRAFPEANGHLQPLDLKDIGSLYDIVASDKQLLDIIKEAKAEGTVLMAEVFVGNLKLERGGTIDLLGVTKDGNYKLYDLKTRYTKDKGIVARYNKLEEFTKQLGEYKKILEEGDIRLGIPKGKLLISKIIESKIDIDTKTGKIKKFNGNEFVAPFFLRTENAKLNDFINRLDGQIKVLKDKKPKDPNKVEAWEKLLTSKLELMQSLQLQQDVNDIIEHSVIELATIKSYMLDQENMDTKDLVSQLLMFASIDDYVDYDSLNPKQQALVRNVKFEAERLYKQVLEMGKNMIVESAVQVGNEKFVDEIFSPIKDITFLRKMVMGVSDVDHPLVNTGYKIMTEALAKSRAKLDELSSKLVPLVEKFREYMGNLDYSVMLTDDKKSLVGKYSSEFWREYNVNKKKRDLDWARKNLVYDKEAYNEAYNKRNQFEESIKENELNKIRAWLSLKEDAPTDPNEFNKYVENIYWKGRKERFDEWFAKHENNIYFYFKPKDKWIDPKWKEIKEGKYKGTPVEEFYDFYTNTMAWANEYVPEHIKPTFIANFTQSFLERSSDLGLVGAIQGKWSELFNNLDLEYDEALYGKIDPYTGEQLRELFVPGLSKVKQAKSTDLGQSLLLFMEGVYRYQELSVIENTINHIRTQIKNSEEVRVDALGNVIDDPTKVSSKKNPAKQVSELFDYYVDAMLYNKYRKAEGGFELKGNGFTQALGLLKKGDSRKVSYAKLADGVVRYTGIRNLAGNLFAPLVNLLGASANQYMTGFGGLYYSNKDLAKAQSLLTAGKAGLTEEGVKLRMIIDWLGVDREKVQRDIFGKMSKNKLEPILEKYNGMTLFRESEILLVESGAGAMILSDKYNIKMEDFDVVQGKLVLKKEFTPLEKEMFRQKVLKVNQSNIGAMNSDDVILAKKWIVGRMLMQHRSWLAPLAYKRWGAKRYDYILEKEIEGRYRVAYRALKFIIGKGYSKGMEALSPEEVAYAKEAFAELMLVVGTGMLLFALKGVDDEEKKEAWYKYTNTVSNRLFGELFFFMDPTGASQFQILLSPAATTSTVQEFGKLMRDSWREVAADMYDDPETIREKAKPTKRIIKMTPGLGQAQRFIDELYNPKED